MIKKLSKKLLLVFSMLAVVLFTVSSCYATPTSATASVQSAPYSIEDIKNSDIYKQYATQHPSWSNYLSGDCYFLIYSNADGTKDNIYIYNVKDGTEYIRSHPTNSSYLTIYNSSGISSNHPYLLIYYDYSTSSFVGTYDSSTSLSANTKSFESYSNFVLRDITTIKVVNAYGINFEPITEHVDVSHEFQSDTSAIVTFDYSSYGTDYVLKYSLAGIEVSTDLTASVSLKNPIIYYPGVTNLKVPENSKVYWILYDSSGELVETDVYTVPEYTSSSVDKEIKYSLSYSEDYKKATLTADLENGAFSDKLYYSTFNAINSATGSLDYGYQVFTGTLELTTNGNIYLYAVDSLGNILDVAVINVTDIFNCTESDFSYYLENDSSLHGGYKLKITPRVKNWGSKVTIKYKINLTSGVTLPYLTFDSNSEKTYCDQDNLIGDKTDTGYVFTGGIASGGTLIINDAESKLADLKGSITFTVYKDGSSEALFTKTYDFNVKSFSPDDLVNGDAGDMSGTLPGSSDNSGDFTDGGYGDITNEDLQDYFNPNSGFWSLIKDVLNCFPGWITEPIFMYLSVMFTIGIII